MTPGDLDTGERLLTLDEVAAATGLAAESWRRYVADARAPEADGYVGRTPIWRESTVTAYMEGRA